MPKLVTSQARSVPSTAYTEVVAEFEFSWSKPPVGRFGVSVLGNGTASTQIWVECTAAVAPATRSGVGGEDGVGGEESSRSRSRSRRHSVVSCSAGVDSTQQGGKSYTGPLPIDVPSVPRTAVPHGDGGPAPPEEDPASSPPPLAATTANAWIHIYVDGCIVEAIFNNRTAFVSLANNAAVPAATTVAFLPRSAAAGQRGRAGDVTGGRGFDGARGEGPLVATATVFQLKPVNNLQ
jgi:hypothetical protein